MDVGFEGSNFARKEAERGSADEEIDGCGSSINVDRNSIEEEEGNREIQKVDSLATDFYS